MVTPPLLSNYVEFCNYRKKFNSTGVFDFRYTSFFYSTTLLPLFNLMIENHSARILAPSEFKVRNYVSTILRRKLETTHGKSYIPLVKLPSQASECDPILRRIYQLQKIDRNYCGGEEIVKYVVGELVDNIYQHSCFSYALVMAQKYAGMGFVDLSFFDNGVTIPKNFADHGWEFKPHEAIIEAIKGLSTKSDERGYGLYTSTKIFVEGLKGQILIVSGSGALYLDKEFKLGYNLKDVHRLDGTLVTLRARYPSPEIKDFYQYVQ